MKKANGQQLSLFDITLEHNTQNIVTESPTVSEPMKTERPIVSGNNFCPYPIPKVDEIIKMIDRSAYKVNRSQLISDVFECGALAISNMVDFTKYDEREKRYLDIMNGYSPDERKLLVDIFSKIFALSSSVVYDNGKFGDYLGELFMRCNQGMPTTSWPTWWPTQRK